MSQSEFEFKPSSVIPHFPNSGMRRNQHGFQREVVAAMLVTYLAAKDDEWGEIEFTSFTTYVRGGKAPLVPDYLALCEGSAFQQILLAVGCMVHDGSITYRSEGGTDYISVGKPLMAFYKRYLAQMAA
jgi:hypothetical protein